jgi:hypothetical protein
MGNDEVARMKNKKMAREALKWEEENVDPFDNYDESPSLGFAGLAILAATFSTGAIVGAAICLL